MSTQLFRKYLDMINEAAVPINDEWFKDGFQTYKIANPVNYKVADEPGTVKTLEGPVDYQAGYYIMGPGPKGEFWPVPPESFAEKYTDNGDGTGTPKKIMKLAKLADHDGFVTVDWGNGPQKLEYTAGNDYIVRHGSNDYGVVKKDIFQKTYDTSQEG